MRFLQNPILILFLCTLVLLVAPTGSAQQSDRTEEAGTDLIWREPGDIASRDFRYGPGAPHLAPAGPFTFIEEDKDGESPKFRVKDARGLEWVVKLGTEAQSETVATRLVWGVGYFAEEAYFLDRVRVNGLPKLSRGMDYVSRRGVVHGARFEPRRNGVKRGDTWDWDKNPFEGTRELDGLKVLMILLNNYDARALNNRVLYVSDPQNGAEAQHVVTDLGATLGRAGGLGGKRSKNNLKDFLSTRFVTGVEKDGSVEFDYDTRPTKLGVFSVFYPPYYRGEVKKEKSMRRIPVENARWIGALLSQVRDDQLRDAFRAARYNPSTMEGFVRTLRQRINQLTRL